MLIALLLLACSNLTLVDTGETGVATYDTAPEIIECCRIDCPDSSEGALRESDLMTWDMCQTIANGMCEGATLSEC